MPKQLTGKGESLHQEEEMALAAALASPFFRYNFRALRGPRMFVFEKRGKKKRKEKKKKALLD